MKTSWNVLAKSIWFLPSCPSHKCPSLSPFIYLPLLSILLFGPVCYSVSGTVAVQADSLMGSSRKSVRMECSSLWHAHTHTHTHTHAYIQQADLFLMELLIFTQAECGKIDSDFHSHSTALICTSICCSTMVGCFIDFCCSYMMQTMFSIL